jgi:predicted dehydrogenase
MPRYKSDDFPNSIGIAGFGNIGKVYAEIFAEKHMAPEIKIADPLIDADNQLIKFLLENSRLNLCRDYRQITDCDTVIIALPNDMHLEAVKFFAHEVKYMLIEKPLGENYLEAKKIADIVHKKNVHAMCGLTGLYHPEFKAMYEQLENIGDLLEVSENLHEANPGLGRHLSKEHGVLAENGIHTLHRFFKIASLTNPKYKLRAEKVELSNDYFKGCPGEDTAKGELALDTTPFKFNVSFRNKLSCDNGKPIDYTVEIQGSEGVIKVTGWEKCESTINGEHKVHYEHPEGPLIDESQHYPRIKIGLEKQIEEFIRFIKSEEKIHFTLEEALKAQGLVEECYRKAHYLK